MHRGIVYCRSAMILWVLTMQEHRVSVAPLGAAALFHVKHYGQARGCTARSRAVLVHLKCCLDTNGTANNDNVLGGAVRFPATNRTFYCSRYMEPQYEPGAWLWRRVGPPHLSAHFGLGIR